MPASATFKREKFDDCYAEARPLLDEHYAELSTDVDIPLYPDVERYQVLEHNGLLRCYTARVQGFIVGYGAFIVQANAHYLTSLQALQDILYIQKDWRRQGLGRQLVRFCDAELKKDGVQKVLQHVKIANPALAPVLQSEGYEPVEFILAKRLDK